MANQPTFNSSTMLLLTDGTVMCQNENASDWWKLTPDQSGSYINGTWSQLASRPNSPEYYASAMRGGSSPVDLLAAEIYDPVADTWSNIPTPSGWTNIGDAPSCVLPDGRILLGSIIPDPSGNNNTAIYNPLSNTWIPAANKDDSSSEETWTLLPDNTILVAECTNHPKAEKYNIGTDSWTPTGSTPSGHDLVQSSSASSNEIGPAILMPDGRVFGIGASGHTAIYSPSTGTWTAGPDFPTDPSNNLMQAFDAPACLLPNGKVLCIAGPPEPSGWAGPPSNFFEFDGTSLSPVPNPPHFWRKNL